MRWAIALISIVCVIAVLAFLVDTTPTASNDAEEHVSFPIF